MRDLFPGFYYEYPKGEELNHLWKDAVFVFDTSMLLNVYRYSQVSLNRYLEILDQLREQLWLPYQVVYEYLKNREQVIEAPLESFSSAGAILDDFSGKLKKLFGPDYNKHFMDPSDLTYNILDEIDEAKSILKKNKKENSKRTSNLIKHDTIREKLESIFHDKFGPPYRREELQEVYKQAALRFELQIPPGWKDEKNKQGVNKYGDVVLWFQIIDFARLRKKPIIFVSDDGKADWWVINNKQERVQPHPELIQEIFVETGVLFYMYQGYEFLDKATKMFGLQENPEVIKEALNTAQWEEIKEYLHQIDQEEEKAKDAVFKWLRVKYPSPQFEVIRGTFGKDLHADFAIQDVAKKVTPIFLMYEYSTRMFDIVEEIKFKIKNIKNAGYEKQIFVYAFENRNSDITKFLIDRFKIEPSLPKDTLIVIGYIERNEEFIIISTFP